MFRCPTRGIGKETMKKTLLALAAMLALQSCTPEQISTFERLSGVDLPADLEREALRADDVPLSTPWGVIEVDGTVTPYAAPAGSRCPQFYDEAMAAGWPTSQWGRLDYVMFRESRCNPTVHNRHDPGYGSFGLVQLNMSKGKYGTWAFFSPMLGGDITKLYDPLTNLSLARQLYQRALNAWNCGWRPWSFRC